MQRITWEEADKRNTGNKDLPGEYPVLQLYIDHGKNVRNASYVYFVHMNSPNLEFLKDFSARQNYEILSRTDSIHAVKLKEEHTTAAVFFEKNASFSDGVRQWRSNDKAIVLIREISDGTVRISVSDPEQKAEKKMLRLSCNPPLNGKKELEFILPDGVNCGKAVSRTFPQ